MANKTICFLAEFGEKINSLTSVCFIQSYSLAYHKTGNKQRQLLSYACEVNCAQTEMLLYHILFYLHAVEKPSIITVDQWLLAGQVDEHCRTFGTVDITQMQHNNTLSHWQTATVK